MQEAEERENGIFIRTPLGSLEYSWVSQQLMQKYKETWKRTKKHRDSIDFLVVDRLLF